MGKRIVYCMDANDMGVNAIGVDIDETQTRIAEII